MWRLILRNTLAHRARLAFTMLAVVLGVTFVSGTLVLTDTSRQVLDDQFRTATAGTDLTVRAAAAFDSAMGVEVERDPLSAATVDRVRTLPGVAGAEPIVRGQGLLVAGGTAIVPSGPSLLQSWTPPPLGAFTLRAGRAPVSDGEVVIDAATADRYRITLGQTVTVRAESDLTAQVVGLAGFGDRPGLPNSTVALVSLPTAQRMLRLGDGVTELAVTAADGADTGALRRSVGAALGAGYEVTAGRDVAAAASAAAQNQVGYLEVMLLALAGAGLLVGAFLIANTFSIVVTQRTHELAVLRATGATGRQVLGSVLGEALLVGVAASALGLGTGIGAAIGLRGLAGAFGIALPDGAMVVTPRTVVVSLAVGVLVTVLAAYGPARRAARVAPVAAMRQSAAAEPIGTARTIAGAIAAAAGAAGVTAAILGAGGMMLLAAAAVALIVGLTLAGPALAPAAARQLGRPLHAFGTPGRLARESAARTPRRTAATALALALGLALVSFTAVLATSVKRSVQRTYTETISADFVVESARNEMLGGLPATVHHHVAELPEVAVASRLRYGHWKDGQTTSALTAVDPATLPRVTALKMTAGSLDALNTGGVVLAGHVAAERGLTIGDTLPMTFSRTGTQNLPVVGLLRDRDAQALQTDYIISLDTYATHYVEDVDASVFVKLADGVGLATGQRVLDAALADMPTAEVRDQAAAVAGRTATIDQVLGLVTALLLLTIVIALLGITNTLALSVSERTREIGLLRAVGMTRAQLRTMVRSEAALLAALATVVGVGLGVALGAGAVKQLGAAAEAAVVLPAAQLALIVAVTLVAGLVAGLLPARRAARLDVLTAITHS
ncbi:FtsX-like permease family protein [Dactylosporangium sp. NPDC000521]|uniref:FtsX-like permease family protein n=1 Tax=Dactylosporangium sp. NPDC000521 TaxID=3363975 RepID=UPI0036C57413